MAKQKKKRSKAYSGEDAKSQRPTITRMTASNRSAAGQWWHEKKRFLKPVIITVLIVLVVAWLLFELFRLLANL